MAGDWIKMRVWLAKDPRVIRMADTIALDRGFMNWLTDPVQQSCKTSAYEHVTRNVTVALCVTGLLVTWGTAREQGDREEDDLVLNHADLITLDAMTDIVGFGEAMQSVGWVEEREEGALVFPKFFKDNESPDEKHKRQNAERQARFRDKTASKSNAEVTQDSNVTVTPREEKRREEKTSIRFAEFWDAWPSTDRKTARAACENKWKLKKLDSIADRVLQHLAAMKETRKWQDGYEPAPLTFINQRHWEDGEGKAASNPWDGAK